MELQDVFKFQLNQKVYYIEDVTIYEGVIKGFQFTFDNGIWYSVEQQISAQACQRTWIKESDLIADKKAAENLIESKGKEFEF